MGMKIIGITGVAHSGKSTAATVLQRVTGGKRDGFAAPLRRFTMEAFGLDEDQIYGPRKEEPIAGVSRRCPSCDGAAIVESWEDIAVSRRGLCSTCSGAGSIPTTPRFAMQTLGTEWGRMVSGGRVWIDWLIRRANVALSSGAPCVIVDDVRFLNEAVAIRNAGGSILRIRRSSVERAAETWRTHSSERDILTEEMGALVTDIPNDGEIEDFVERMTRLGMEIAWRDVSSVVG